MLILEEMFSFVLPDKWKDLVGAIKKSGLTNLILLSEKGSGKSGLLVSLKSLKHQKTKEDEYSELLGILIKGEQKRYLYAVYGKEGCVSEKNEDLYWRLRDQLWMVFDSISALEGCSWQPV